jgi:hypothetical protein
MRFVFTLLIYLFALPAFAAETAYFSALPDLPVAPGLSEAPDSAVRFDQPEGRVVVLQASGVVQESEIKSFYQKALPALGWQPGGDGRFTRDHEALTLEIKPQQVGQVRLNVLLRPL